MYLCTVKIAHVGAILCVNTQKSAPLHQRHQCDSAETLFVLLSYKYHAFFFKQAFLMKILKISNEGLLHLYISL